MSSHDDDRGPWDEIPRGLGLVLDDERGSLPYVLLHGEALVTCAAWSLGDSGVDLVDATVEWDAYVEAGRDLVLHDALCPMTPPSFITECLERARASRQCVVGVRPVTDTVKVVDRHHGNDTVGATLDRDSLVSVASPLVIPGSVVAVLDRRPPTDLAQAVAGLAAAGHPVGTVLAPPEGRRVSSLTDLRLLDALTTTVG